MEGTGSIRLVMPIRWAISATARAEKLLEQPGCDIVLRCSQSPLEGHSWLRYASARNCRIHIVSPRKRLLTLSTFWQGESPSSIARVYRNGLKVEPTDAFCIITHPI